MEHIWGDKSVRIWTRRGARTIATSAQTLNQQKREEQSVWEEQEGGRPLEEEWKQTQQRIPLTKYLKLRCWKVILASGSEDMKRWSLWWTAVKGGSIPAGGFGLFRQENTSNVSSWKKSILHAATISSPASHHAAQLCRMGKTGSGAGISSSINSSSRWGNGQSAAANRRPLELPSPRCPLMSWSADRSHRARSPGSTGYAAYLLRSMVVKSLCYHWLIFFDSSRTWKQMGES